MSARARWLTPTSVGERALALTGERTLPGIPHERYWFTRHEAAYRFAADRCSGLRVLDAGCGEGYGAARMARTAAEVVGVDYAAEVVAHARQRYTGVPFIEAELGNVPLQDAAFHAVVGYQVIEHVWDVDRFLAEMVRLLRPGGLFLCSTPNRLTSPGGNPFHAREFTAAGLRDALAPWFRVEHMLGVHHGRRLRAVERVAGRSLPELLLERTPENRPPWLHVVVRATRISDFALRPEGIDASLDLLAIASRR